MHTSGHGTLFSTVYESTYVVLPLVKYNYINHIHTKKMYHFISIYFRRLHHSTLLHPRIEQVADLKNYQNCPPERCQNYSLEPHRSSELPPPLN